MIWSLDSDQEGELKMLYLFTVRQLQEKYLEKKEELWIAFLDLEKPFDRVPREVVWWTSKQMDVDGWLIDSVKAEN